MTSIQVLFCYGKAADAAKIRLNSIEEATDTVCTFIDQLAMGTVCSCNRETYCGGEDKEPDDEEEEEDDEGSHEDHPTEKARAGDRTGDQKKAARTISIDFHNVASIYRILDVDRQPQHTHPITVTAPTFFIAPAVLLSHHKAWYFCPLSLCHEARLPKFCPHARISLVIFGHSLSFSLMLQIWRNQFPRDWPTDR